VPAALPLRAREEGTSPKEPLGWKNVETFLKNGPLNKGNNRGVFHQLDARGSLSFRMRLRDRDGESALLQTPAWLNIEAENRVWLLLQIAEMVLVLLLGTMH